MPVPLTTAALALAAIFLPISEIATIVVGTAGIINQAIVSFASAQAPPRSDDGLG